MEKNNIIEIECIIQYLNH